jgi:acetyl-CoA carboxylase beta subunit
VSVVREVIYNKDLAATSNVCPSARTTSGSARSSGCGCCSTADWQEYDRTAVHRPLKFVDTKPYQKRLDATIARPA